MANTINSVIGAPSGAPIGAADAAASSAIAKAGAGTNLPVAPVASQLDQNTLSPLANLLNSATHAALALSSFRPDRVAELQSAISAGAYQPDLAQIAQIVAHALKDIGA
jgi:flagellar biosynthesis anti-sigma factor FlgM